jgi:hypothetical protein
VNKAYEQCYEYLFQKFDGHMLRPAIVASNLAYQMVNIDEMSLVSTRMCDSVSNKEWKTALEKVKDIRHQEKIDACRLLLSNQGRGAEFFGADERSEGGGGDEDDEEMSTSTEAKRPRRSPQAAAFGMASPGEGVREGRTSGRAAPGRRPGAPPISQVEHDKMTTFIAKHMSMLRKQQVVDWKTLPDKGKIAEAMETRTQTYVQDHLKSKGGCKMCPNWLRAVLNMPEYIVKYKDAPSDERLLSWEIPDVGEL